MRTQELQKATYVGALAVIGLLILAMVPSFGDASITGAVTGSSDAYKKCMENGKKGVSGEGKYTFPRWDWDWIKKCREYVLSYEENTGGSVSRLVQGQNAYEAFLEAEEAAELEENNEEE